MSEQTNEPNDLAQSLRKIRAQKGFSLQEVEERSNGQLRASVVGSYERGERQVSVKRLQELASFYKVPLSELLPDDPHQVPANQRSANGKVVVDLNALEQVKENYPELMNYVQVIQSRRGDYNGQIITMRTSDIETLAATIGKDAEVLHNELAKVGVIRD